MPDLDRVRDSAVLILQRKQDWMSATEIRSRIHPTPDIEQVEQVMKSMCRGNKLAESREIGEGEAKKTQWRAANMQSIEEKSDGT